MAVSVSIWALTPIKHTIPVALYLMMSGSLLAVVAYCMTRAGDDLKSGAPRSALYRAFKLSWDRDDYGPEGQQWLKRYWLAFTVLMVIWIGGGLLLLP